MSVSDLVRIDWVQVASRHRKDLRDLTGLINSIEDVGVINPITVTPDGRLIAGQRRLEACRKLGWDSIPARVVDNLDDAAGRLRAERDENTEREPMRHSELVSLGLALEELERPRAAARKRVGRPPKTHVPENMSSDEPTGATAEVVADALGISRSTYDRAKHVVAAANDPTLTEPERRVAQDALADMDATGVVQPNYDRVKDARFGRPSKPAIGRPPKPTIETAAAQRRAIKAALTSLSGISHGLERITDLHPQITNEEATQWVGGLSEARRVLESLINRLRERTK